MAKKKDPQETASSPVVEAAKVIGSAVGKIAHLAGVHGSPQPKTKVTKLQKKNKSRLPRRQKKAMRKAQQPSVTL